MGFTENIMALMLVLTFISYYLGVFLSAVVPSRRFRSFGKEMVEDSISSIGLLVFISGIMLVIDFVYGLLYGAIPGVVRGVDAAHELLLQWINNELGFVFSAMFRIRMIPILLDSLDASGFGFGVFGILSRFIDRMMAPWSLVVSGYGGSLSLLRAWVIFIRYSWLILLFAGALIWTFPAGIGRIAGSWLMSMSIAYYALLPLMGVFVDLMTMVTLADILGKFQATAEEAYLTILANKAAENPEAMIATVISGLFSGIGEIGTILLLRFVFVGLFFTLVSAAIFSLARGFGATGRRLRLPGLPRA